MNIERVSRVWNIEFFTICFVVGHQILNWARHSRSCGTDVSDHQHCWCIQGRPVQQRHRHANGLHDTQHPLYAYCHGGQGHRSCGNDQQDKRAWFLYEAWWVSAHCMICQNSKCVSNKKEVTRTCSILYGMLIVFVNMFFIWRIENIVELHVWLVDEDAFKMLAVYSAIALHFSRVCWNSRRYAARLNCFTHIKFLQLYGHITICLL